jgi:hypothetical protein
MPARPLNLCTCRAGPLGNEKGLRNPQAPDGLLCPSCTRRCRLLYGGTYFRCRLCVGAYYESQYETAPYRALRRRWRIRKRIEDRSGDGWPFGLDDGFPPRPPRMHRRTFERLEALDAELARAGKKGR